jgi:hypothetical protein
MTLLNKQNSPIKPLAYRTKTHAYNVTKLITKPLHSTANISYSTYDIKHCEQLINTYSHNTYFANITQNQVQYLTSANWRALIKLHKQNSPIKPLVCGTKTHAYNVTKLITMPLHSTANISYSTYDIKHCEQLINTYSHNTFFARITQNQVQYLTSANWRALIKLHNQNSPIKPLVYRTKPHAYNVTKLITKPLHSTANISYSTYDIKHCEQ